MVYAVYKAERYIVKLTYKLMADFWYLFLYIWCICPDIFNQFTTLHFFYIWIYKMLEFKQNQITKT